MGRSRVPLVHGVFLDFGDRTLQWEIHYKWRFCFHGKSPTNEVFPLPCLIAEGMPFAVTPPFSGLFFRFQRRSACFRVWLLPHHVRKLPHLPDLGGHCCFKDPKNQSLPLGDPAEASGSAGGAAVSCTEEFETHPVVLQLEPALNIS